MKKKVSVYQIEKALAKSEAIKSLIKSIKERMKCCDFYINHLEVKYFFQVKLDFSYLNYWGEECTESKKFFIEATDCIKTNFDFNGNPRRKMLSLFAKWVIEEISYSDFDLAKSKVSVKVDSKNEEYQYISSMTAWGSEDIGIYYVEQECGEHWIILPKEPKKIRSSFHDISD